MSNVKVFSAGGEVAVVHYTRCWSCQFGEHPTERHTWMGGEDLKHEGMTRPTKRKERRALAALRPCACDCAAPVVRPRASADRTRGKRSRLGTRRNRRLVAS